MRLLHSMCARASGCVCLFVLWMTAGSTAVSHNSHSGMYQNLAELKHAMIADIIQKFTVIIRLLFRLEELETPAYNLYNFNRRNVGPDIVFLDLIVKTKTRSIYVVAVLVVVRGCPVEGSGKGVSRGKRRHY
ncbi:hypothetical protein BKA61DRAFT_663103 [Leptodontidium sp. MPI-SDFR-AT-0119]|nr:hypothetical protein BKA61DRAFT_663103 [Leptodontidium sp. MPI-SDFR-AT-0119]